MNFTEFERVEYKHHILFEVVFQVRFPEIMRILKEDPVDFQEIVRKEGYPELVLDIPALPSNMPKEIEEAASTAKVFHFISEEKDWKISLTRGFIALTCSGNYRNYMDFRGRLEKVLLIFSKIYEPSYFTRIGLMHKNVANKVFLPHTKQEVEAFIPEHIFPELATIVAEDIETLQKISLFNDGEVRANVVHVLSKVSGRFKKRQFTNEKSYIIEIDCYSESRTEGINNVLTNCDTFKQLNWDIFQWSITEKLRDAMGRSK